MVERMVELSQGYAITIGVHALMSNHNHVVLRLNPDQAANWCGQEVMQRWQELFHMPMFVSRYQQQLPRVVLARSFSAYPQ